jgi:hypothetical protein
MFSDLIRNKSVPFIAIKSITNRHTIGEVMDLKFCLDLKFYLDLELS